MGKKILIIQTAFIGDVVLATSLVENLSNSYPNTDIHFLLRKGNEELLSNNPGISKVHIWNKKAGKYKEMIRMIKIIRSENYYLVINVQRFLSTGIITALSGAKIKVGFRKNPLSFLFDKRVQHEIGNGSHEIERNHKLISEYTDLETARPKLYINETTKKRVTGYQETPYVCVAPSSVWFTKQFPESRWIELVDQLENDYKIYLIGGPVDFEMCERILTGTKRKNIMNLAGKLSFLESASLMQEAIMNYVNDSAPLHFASAVNARVRAIFCSTVPEFGFGPLSDDSKVVQVSTTLDCRPCGIHGKRQCPEGHFKCAYEIEINSMLL